MTDQDVYKDLVMDAVGSVLEGVRRKEKLNNSTVVAEIKWFVADIKESLESNGFVPCEKNVSKVINQCARALVDLSIQEGWVILDELLSKAAGLIKQSDIVHVAETTEKNIPTKI